METSTWVESSDAAVPSSQPRPLEYILRDNARRRRECAHKTSPSAIFQGFFLRPLTEGHRRVALIAKPRKEANPSPAGNAQIVLIGDGSHGTHEFYAHRANITHRLIEEKGFTAVAVEADWPDAFRINRSASFSACSTSSQLFHTDLYMEELSKTAASRRRCLHFGTSNGASPLRGDA